MPLSPWQLLLPQKTFGTRPSPKQVTHNLHGYPLRGSSPSMADNRGV